ncbi:MAG: 16S rRNA (cytidine(1402)-2'-O)-methyltransferase [Gammaproteobacteria bacterium]|nr:16S rRNA (cytidine(1402)-2'-O)-methyltransferase [Gammaproteobacteria bacterium]
MHSGCLRGSAPIEYRDRRGHDADADDHGSEIIVAAEQAAGGKRTSHQSEPAERGRGRLEVVATPIGNLADLSPRAREALADADLIAAEDTRRSSQLLSALGLQKPLISLHAHNERERGDALLARLLAGEVIALVSDAGTPLLSDPGFDLVQRAAAAGLEVRSVPGPTAIAAALSVAAVPTDRFCFEGFLPAKPRERRERLEALRREPRTLVFFEAPHRIVAALQDCAAVLGGTRQAAVARELTKLHESVYRGRLEELAQRAAQEPAFERGEITLVIAGTAVESAGEGEATMSAPIAADAVMERVLRAALAHLPAAKAAAIAAAASGLGREAAYARAVELAAARR